MRRLLSLVMLVTLTAMIFTSFACNSRSNDSQNKTEVATKDDGNKDKSGDNSRIVATFTPESKSSCEYNPPTIVDGYIYIGTSTKINLEGQPTDIIAALPVNFFYKMDTNFKIVWKYALDKTQFDGGATLDSRGNIYFVTITYSVNPASPDSTKNLLTTLNLISLTNDGQFRWQKQISGPTETWIHAMINCAIGTDDTIYVGDSKLFAFDTDGNIKWQYPNDNRYIVALRSSPIIDNAGNIYFVSPDPTDSEWGSDVIRLYKFAPDSNGIPTWTVELDNNILDPEGGTDNGGGHKENWMLSSPAFSAGFKSVYVAVGNTINRVDAQTGAILWSMKPDGATGSFKESPAVDAEDNVYIGTKSNIEGTLFAIKADGSGLLWKNVMGADLYPSPLLGDDGKLYIGSEGVSNGSHFHAVDMKTGAIAWDTGFGKGPMPDISFSSPALYKGYIYIGTFSLASSSDSAALIKIKADASDYLPNAAWPRFHGSNANTGRK